MNEGKYLMNNYGDRGGSSLNMLTSIDPSMFCSSSIVYVQVCPAPQIFSKQQMSPFEMSSCCSCHVFSYFFAQFLLLKRVKCPPFFQVHNQNNSTSSPGLLGQRCLNVRKRCIFDVISSLKSNFFKIWSSVTGYGELNVCFKPIRIREIF